MESIYEGLVEPYYKTIGNMPPVLVTAVKR